MTDSTTIDINADLDTAWAVMTDVADWSNWTDSITSVERLDEGPLHVGSRARVKQPGIPAAVWEVTELRDRQEFIWRAGFWGSQTSGVHRLTPNPDGSIRLTLELRPHGAISRFYSAMTRARNLRYIAMEAAGMKNASETVRSQA